MMHFDLMLFIVLGVSVDIGSSFPSNGPKALSVDCHSLGSTEAFKQRLKLRKNAEDQTTIWLFKDEELSIHFHMPQPAVIDILDVRYSNDGGVDKIALRLDETELGTFDTVVQYNWGFHWNHFESSGAVGGPRLLARGDHKLTISIIDSDPYGVEIDYIRFNVHGSKVDHLERDQFMCVHKPNRKPDKHTQNE